MKIFACHLIDRHFRDGTAIGGAMAENGVDYKTTSGVLCFKHQETSKTIDVEINKNTEVRFSLLCMVSSVLNSCVESLPSYVLPSVLSNV